MTQFWWCNQTRCWPVEHAASLVCAHDTGSPFREMVSEAKRGDITVHYRARGGGRVVAISRARTNAERENLDIRRYTSSDSDCWSTPAPALYFEAEYFELPTPIPRSAFLHKIVRLQIEKGPTVPSGTIRQGYFMRFTGDGLKVLRNLSRDPWPAWADRAIEML
jgi:hypothetical protein